MRIHYAPLAAAILMIFGGLLSYDWSFTETTFGGWLGFVSVPVLILMAYLLGFVRGLDDLENLTQE